MSSTAAPSAPLPPAVSPRHALLEELIATTLRHANAQFAELCTSVAGALCDGGVDADIRTVQLRIRAGNLLRDRRFAFLHLSATALERAIRQEIAQLAPAPTLQDVQPEAPLALVPLEQLDRQLTCASAARPLDAEHELPLAMLGARLARLFERNSLRSNPFRPALFIGALQQSWSEFNEEEGAAALLLPLLTPERLALLGALYEALNLLLERRGVLPGVVDARPRPAPHDGRKQADLSRRLHRFFAAQESGPVSAPEYAPGFATERGAAGTHANLPLDSGGGALLSYLAGLPSAPPAGSNVFHLPAIKRDAPRGSLSRADEGTIDLLASVFDNVFRDGAIAHDIRDLILYLQVPVLKAALADRDFFFTDAHPARRLLELLSRMGWERTQRGDARRDDPLYQAMQRSVDRAARDEAFGQAVDELEASLQSAEQAAQEAIAAPIAAALQQEKAATARRAAQDAVATRLADGDVAAVVAAFLQDKWTDVLAIAYGIEDEKPGAVRHATQAMDQLVWSVRPKLTPDERRQLVATLPGLLAALNKWLDAMRWHDADRLRFFADLAECHASIVRAPLDLTPERHVELAVRAAQQDAEKRLAPAAPVHVETDGLARGTWLAFAPADGPPRQVKLAWISPLRTLFIFSNGAREEAFSLSADDLARQLRAGTATVLQTEGVVERALSQALAANDAATDFSAGGEGGQVANDR